jgi:hypothetical protein
MRPPPLAIRWTIGDVAPQGFEALRFSIWGAYRVFGPATAYVVCVNSVPLDRAQQLTGEVPTEVRWRDVTGELPAFLKPHLDTNMAEGVGWKFAPLRLFPDRFELALDNDCILWDMPAAIKKWLDGHGSPFVVAEDARTTFGQFVHLCGPEPRNSGIRGLPPGFDLEAALRRILAEHPMVLSSELDEQGLQVAIASRDGPPLMVTRDDVSICSPFPPHAPQFGRCGVHFVGLNARHLPCDYEGRPAVAWIRENWLRHRGELSRKVGLNSPEHALHADSHAA